MSKATAVAGQYETLGSGLVLLGAFVSFVLSVSLWFSGHADEGIFVDIWVPIGVALPVYGAILDGRYQVEREAADVLDLSTKQTGCRPAA